MSGQLILLSIQGISVKDSINETELGCVTSDKSCNASNFEFPQFIITTLWGFGKNEKRR